MPNRSLILAFSAFACLLGTFPAAAEPPTKTGEPIYVQTRLVPEFSALIPGKPLTVAIEQTIQDGWDTYWKNPGDSGEPTRLKWSLPAGFTAGEIDWPTPERMEFGPLVNFGYKGKIALLSQISVPDQLPYPEATFTVDASWLVCSDICVPEYKTLTLTLPVAKTESEAKPIEPELFSAARKALPASAAWQGMVEEQNQALLLSLRLEPEDKEALRAAKSVAFFPEEWGIILNAAPQESIDDPEFFKLRMTRDSRPLSAISSLNGVLAYETENGERKGVQLHIPMSTALAEMAPPHPEQELGSPDQKTATTGIGIGKAIFLAFLGGLILNLMPCVFPVLSMKALSLVKMSEKEQSHASLHGVLYTIGVLVCFSLIAGILISLQAAGEKVGWGFQLQDPVIVLLLAYLFFAMGLSLSGFLEVGGARLTSLGQNLTRNRGYAGSFFTGMLATIVATPCTAPFMGTAMGFALTQPDQVALAVFLALGFGLAFPYLILCIVPPLRKALPKPGAWMETFREFLAFPLYASAAWLVWVYGQQTEGTYTTLLALTGIILIAMAVWIWRFAPARAQPMRGLLASLAILCVLLSFGIAATSMVKLPGKLACLSSTPKTEKCDEEDLAQQAKAEANGHIPFTQNMFDEAIAGDAPVFVNMTAAWCITCKVNERVALATDDTKALFRSKNISYFVGDWTNQNPEITEFLETYGRSGVPLYVYFGPRDKISGERPDPEVLPQLLTPGLVADVIGGN
jgi:thiol:disulfide interchange protein/DsbC/DsbD-like thiol-disulfide interchange protein